MGLEEIIRKHTLKNAFDYGKANAGAVVGKVIAEFPEAKRDMKATMHKINAAVSDANKLRKEEIEKALAEYTFAERPKEEKKTIEIAGAEKGRVVVRYPPEPNGWPHIGHAKAFCLSSEIAKNYDGKIILRWDDTNPEAEKKEFVDAIKDGIKWLGLAWDEEIYCSDYLPKMYELCERLIANGDAYSCKCKQDEIAKGREEMKRCACADKKPKDNLNDWKGMIGGKTGEGSTVIRLKGDMASANTVMRDPTLFRIITAPHYRQGKKYRVWPTYDFQGAVMDSISGITHPIRSKEYELRDETYVFLLKKLGLRVPQMISISRLAIKNAPVSKRLLRPLVETKKLSGWDDPRLPTLAGLKRRGILPEAIRSFVLSFGISKVESEPTLELLLTENRKLIDQSAERYFFVPNPVKMKINGAHPQLARLKLHPTKNLGHREMAVKDTVFISNDDADQLKQGEVFRLKDLYNVKLAKKGKELIADYDKHEGMADKKIQWVSEEYVDCEVLVPMDLVDSRGEFNKDSLKVVKGYCENNCERLNEGTIIQFERFGFCILDKRRKDRLTFIYVC